MRSVQVSEPKGPLEVVERDIPEPGYDKEPSEEHDYYKDCWKQPKRYLGILFLIARFIEIRFERKIECGGMRLERSVEKT